MKTLVLDVFTPNYDGPDGSYTRLLVVPITPKLREYIKDATSLLELAPRATEIESVTSKKRHAYLIRPSLAQDGGLSKRLDAITEAVHATGYAVFDEPPLTKEELFTLRDETGGIKGTTLARAPGYAPLLRWAGYFAGDTEPVLAWNTTPLDTQIINEGATP